MIYVLILAIQGFDIKGGVVTAEFNTLAACENAIAKSKELWRADGICVPSGVSHV